MRYRIGYKFYMTVDANNEEEAIGKADSIIISRTYPGIFEDLCMCDEIDFDHDVTMKEED